MLLVLVAGAYVWFGTDLSTPRDTERVVVSFALPDEHDVDVAQMVMMVDATEEAGSVSVEVIDPLVQVMIPGTSYDTLADAYVFGGGGGVADAVGRLVGESDLGWVVLSRETVVTLIDVLGGLSVDIPQDVNVFTGGVLHLFSEGPTRLSGVQFCAYLAGVNHVSWRKPSWKRSGRTPMRSWRCREREPARASTNPQRTAQSWLCMTTPVPWSSWTLRATPSACSRYRCATSRSLSALAQEHRSREKTDRGRLIVLALTLQ